MEAEGKAEGFGVFGSYATIEDDSFRARSQGLVAQGRHTRGHKRPRPGAAGAPPARRARPSPSSTSVEVPLEFSSPYGVRPEGCAFGDYLDRGIRPLRTGEAMGPLAALPDDLMLYLLGFLDGPALATLSAASRPLYVFAHHADLWRSLTLGAFGGNWAFAGDWKSTLVNALLAQRAGASRYAGHRGSGTSSSSSAGGESGSGGGDSGSSIHSGDHLPFVHSPISVAGFYSDLLFKYHACAAAAIPPGWYETHHTIPRVSARELTLAQFVERFEGPAIPVIITDVVPAWPAFTAWTPASLSARHGGAPFHCGGVSMTLRDYLFYCARTSGSDDRPLYLFERHWAQAAPGLGCDVSTPPFFADDLTALLPPGVRPDHSWMIAGPRKSGSTWHKDPNASSAWNAAVVGDKAWVLYPPAATPPGVVVSADGTEVATPASVMEWYLDHFHKHDDTMKRQAEAAGAGAVGDTRGSSTPARVPMAGVQRAGEVLFVARGWWHQVLNLTDTIAVTSNFVSPRGLAPTLELWRDDPAAISGVPPGRQGDMYALFTAALEAHRPEELARARAEMAAQAQQRAGSEGEGEGEGRGAGGAASGQGKPVGRGAGSVRVRWSSLLASSSSGGGAPPNSTSSNGAHSEAQAAASGSGGFSFGFAPPQGTSEPEAREPAAPSSFAFGFAVGE